MQNTSPELIKCCSFSRCVVFRGAGGELRGAVDFESASTCVVCICIYKYMYINPTTHPILLAIIQLIPVIQKTAKMLSMDE